MKILEYSDGMKVISNGIQIEIGGKRPVSEIPLDSQDFEKLMKNPNLTKNYTKGRIKLPEKASTEKTA